MLRFLDMKDWRIMHPGGMTTKTTRRRKKRVVVVVVVAVTTRRSSVSKLHPHPKRDRFKRIILLRQKQKDFG